MEAYPERKEADQEELEANQGRIEAIVEHYEGAPSEKAMHVLTTLQDQAPDILHGGPEGVTYDETIGETED
jgi:hypothetical protein